MPNRLDHCRRAAGAGTILILMALLCIHRHVLLPLLIERLRSLQRVMHRCWLLRYIRGGAQTGSGARHPHGVANHCHTVDLAGIGDAIAFGVAHCLRDMRVACVRRCVLTDARKQGLI
ncbi:hypothetical protein ACU10_04365 [Xanthomonas oryzae pv. oryzicola]|uniref:hypothetical protein n=2 Tax=Xanthomonas oryzae TaxID=347 RepID=UPI000656323A|nr:hypothetical protein [Xanthomonas oryzae]AKN92392.1 hypothetical protein ACU13_04380 [Xanthomonas oryzae pv. oryzicola]AKN96129.1 hypothetical protein ACU10_04365 [Xanthomonas oryzae pv. oryzicola]AKO11351.1 hypothetical protein ACU14_04350 [Xanthomonas oryzae pv. oryzicola]AKO15089.1 hypothetical protein ACU12_04375 [Xanthomonas oryzae pv. oryzicola]